MKKSRVHLTEYPALIRDKDRNLIRRLLAGPNYRRLAKVRNLKRCPRRARLWVRQAKRNTVIVFSTAPAVDPWSESMIAEAVKHRREMAAVIQKTSQLFWKRLGEGVPR